MPSTWIEEAILKRLLADSSVTAIVSRRIYYMQSPQNVEFPYIVFYIAVDSDERVIVGNDGSSPLFTFDIFGKPGDLVDLKTVDKAVRTSLMDYTGALDGITVIMIYREGARDLIEDDGIIRLSRDYKVEYLR